MELNRMLRALRADFQREVRPELRRRRYALSPSERRRAKSIETRRRQRRESSREARRDA